MNNFEKLAEMLGVEIGEEFEISGVFGKCVIRMDGVKLIRGEANRLDISANLLLSSNIIKQPWKPKNGDKYYVVDFVLSDGYESYVWADDINENCAYNRATLYRTEEEVKARVKELEESGEKWI